MEYIVVHIKSKFEGIIDLYLYILQLINVVSEGTAVLMGAVLCMSGCVMESMTVKMGEMRLTVVS